MLTLFSLFSFNKVSAVTYSNYNPSWPDTTNYVPILSDGPDSTVSDPANDIVGIDYQQNVNTGFGFFKVNVRATVTGQNVLTSNRYFIYFDTNADGINEYLLYNTTQGDTKSVLCVWTTFGSDTRWSTRFDSTPPTYGYSDMLYNRADNDSFIEMACKLSHIGNPLDIIQAAASANPNVFPEYYNDPSVDPQFDPGTVTEPGQAGSGILIVNPNQIPWNNGTTYGIVTVLDSTVTTVIFEWLSASSTVLSCSTASISGIGSSTSAKYISGGLGDLGLHYCRATFNSSTSEVGAKVRSFQVYKGNLPPEISNLLTPENGLKTNNHSPEFIWSIATDTDGDPVKYKLQVDNDYNFNTPEVNTAFSSSTTTTLGTWLPTDLYYWRVISQDTLNATNTSATYWFIAFDTTQKRIISDSGQWTYYLGTWDGSTDYTPVTYSSNTIIGTDTVTITVFDAKHPNATDTTGSLGNQFFLSRWYRIESNGSITNANVILTYTDADLADAGLGLLPESGIKFAEYKSGNWSWFNATSRNTTVNQVELDGITSLADWTLMIENQAPTAVSLIQPVNASSTQDHTPLFAWNPATDPDGNLVNYKIQVDNNNNFSSLEFETSFGSATEAVPGTELATGVYYWQVISRDTLNAVNTSAVWTVTILNRPPNAVSLIQPANGSSTQDHTPLFAWNPGTDPDVGDSIQYSVQVDNNSNFSSPEYAPGFSSGTSVTPVSELGTGFYYWRVISKDTSLAQNTSAVWTVTIENRPPNAVTLDVPLDGTQTQDHTPYFRWFTATDPDAGDTDTYEIQVDNNADFSSPEYTSGFGSVTTRLLVAELETGLYYWHVISRDTSLATNTSETRTLTIKNRPPNAVSLISPTNASSTGDHTPTFIWSKATDPDVGDIVSYQVQVDDDINFGSIDYQNAFNGNTSATPVSEFAMGLYYWRVISRDTSFATNTSAVWTVIIYTMPGADFSATPTSGAAPLLVSFYDTSTGDITNWFWTFGDGSTSTLQNPTHTYINYGTYTVKLIVQNTYAASTMTKNNYISVISSMLYSTFIGGSSNDEGYSIAVDSSGSAYITGYTASANFPITVGAYDTSYNTNNDVFIAKLNPAGTGLIYSTYLGGSGDDRGYGIKVDNQGNACIAGFTVSNNFPVTINAYDTTYNAGGGDAFVSKINNTGSGLIYSTYLGSGNLDQGEGIALDTSGNIYITGFAYAGNYPVTNGAYDQTFNGYVDVFVTKLNPALTGTASLVYSTFLGGNYYDYGYAIDVDNVGNAYITGYTQSTNFPVTIGAYDTTFNGSFGTSEVFVSKLNATGSNLVYSTYFGGTGNDYGSAITVDTGKNSYITGYTASTDFPIIVGAFDTTYNGGSYDAFITKLNSTGATLVYSTYLGGTGSDSGNDIGLDNMGNAYVIGATASTNFPITVNGYDTAYNSGVNDIFFSKINTAGSTLKYSTFLGGTNDDGGLGIALTKGGNIYMTGYTASANFPTTITAFDTSYNGGRDVFVTKMCFNNQPSSVNLLVPSICTTNNRYPTFIWSESIDGDFEDTTAYHLQVSNNTNFAGGLGINLTGLNDTTYTVSTPLPPEKYYWRVISQDTFLSENTSGVNWFIAYDTTQSRMINSTSTVVFYLGTWGNSTDYTPVTFSANSIVGVDTVKITIFDAKHPNAPSQYFLSRWFKINSNGKIKSANMALTYIDADFTDAMLGSLTEDSLQVAKYSSGTWSYYSSDTHDTIANWVQLNGITSFSDWTLSGPGGVPVELSRFEAILPE